MATAKLNEKYERLLQTYDGINIVTPEQLYLKIDIFSIIIYIIVQWNPQYLFKYITNKG
jgi:hypothetical protein